MHRLAKRFMGFFKRQVRPSLCADCKVKMDRKFGVKHTHTQKKGKTKGRKLTGKAKEAFLRRINAGRRKKGLKPIHAKR